MALFSPNQSSASFILLLLLLPPPLMMMMMMMMMTSQLELCLIFAVDLSILYFHHVN
jgi:hypothetical protein